MIRLIRAESTKILTTRMWWILGIILLGYVGLLSAGLAALLAGAGTRALGEGPSAAELGPLAPLIYGFASSVGYVFPVLFGALATTGEFRHATLTPTFLATPRRAYVLVAKSVVLLLVGAVYGIAGLIGSVGLGAPLLAAFGHDTQLGDGDTWLLMGRIVIAMALWAVIGVGLGTLIPSQVAAIVIVLAFTQVVEPVLRVAAAFTDWTAQVAQFLPGAASDALVGSSFIQVTSSTGPSLEWWQGGLVLLAMAVAATIGGYFTSWRRDVT